MRNGDSYKIKSMAETGVSIETICRHFRNSYTVDEVKRFIPSAVSDSDTTPPKKKARKRMTATE